MKTKRTLLAVIVVGVSLAVRVQADDTNTIELLQKMQRRIDELEQKVQTLERAQTPVVVTNDTQQIQALDQKVKVMERNQELAEEAALAKAKEAPKISIGSHGFSFANADNSFALQLRGVVQVDSRTFFGDAANPANDGFLLRRARPIIAGTVFRDFDFLFVPDFAPTAGPQIFDAFINYKYSPELQLRSGKFKSPIGLEQLQADQDLTFNERALPTSLVPNRDIGFDLHGDLYGGVASYDAGVFNGVGDARNSANADISSSIAFEGRVFFQPFKRTSWKDLAGLGFGLSGGYETIEGTNATLLPNTTGGTLAGYTTDGQQQFFAYNPASGSVVASGDHRRLSPQGYWYDGPFSLMGEYVISNQRVSRVGAAPLTSANINNTAWEVTGGWVLTGEDATFKGIEPRHPFNPRTGHWGAWQIVGRYAELHIDDNAFPLYANPLTSANSAAAWSVGINWWLNRNVRLMTSYSQTRFTGGGAGSGSTVPGSVTRGDEKVLFTRMQLAF
jgi:phosphate-selective porin OprO/OprP